MASMPPSAKTSKNGPVGGGPPSGKPKMTKLEKIAELESRLKLAKEENRRLLKQQQQQSRSPFPSLPHGNSSSGPGSLNSSSTQGTPSADVDKMKQALKALKRVTVQQEMSLQALREKSSQRRQELEARDATIVKLKKQLAALTSTAPNNSNSRMLQLLQTLQQAKDRNVELQELLEATEQKVEALESQLRKTTNNNSTTTAGRARGGGLLGVDTDPTVTQLLKRELVRKSNRIVELEYELEQFRQQLNQQQEQQNAFPDDVGSNTSFSKRSADVSEQEALFTDNEDGFHEDFFHEEEDGDNGVYDDDDDDEDWP